MQITVTALGSAEPAWAATPDRLGTTAHGAMPHEADKRAISPAGARSQRSPTVTYKHVFNGFAARLTPAQLNRLRFQPSVAAIE
ncbi:protease inhibitor I9 family protein, partial [Sphaerisporangium sp. NPDC049002]|uniref:protease inhibitor I9 family protein n=1 Tax=Sphaerisporangium sp. NPDC049002 TaxID=3155392 RepID=UPI00340A8247